MKLTYSRERVSYLRRLFSLLLLASVGSSPIWASPAPAKHGSLVAIDPVSRAGLIDVGRHQGIAAGDTVIVFREGKEIARATIGEVFSDASKTELPADGSFAEGMVVQIIPAPESSLKHLTRVFQERFSGSLTTGFNIYSLGGNSQKTFHERGFHYFEEVDLTYRDRMAENINVEGQLNFQVSDDTYVQPENFSGRRLSLAMTEIADRYGFVVGDFYTYFSHYSMSQSLKGVKGYYTWPSDAGVTKLTAVFGTTKHRWEEFYKNLENEPFNRYVTGARIEHSYRDIVGVGFNYVDSRDDAGSDGPATIAPVSNDLLSVDFWAKPWDRFNIKGEGAYAWTDLDAERKVQKRTKLDTGVKIDMDWLLTDFEYFTNRMYYGFEQADQNFSSLSGILKTDRQEHYVRHRLDIGKQFSSYYQFNRFWNNLQDGLTVTTKTIKNDVHMIIRPDRQHLDTEVVVDLFKTRNESTNQANTTDNDTESLYLQLKTQVEQLSVWSGVKLWRRNDELKTSNRRKTQTVDAGFRGDWQYQDWRISPYFSYEFERDREPTVSTRSTMNRVNMGTTVSNRNVELKFMYIVHDEDNRILGNNVNRNLYELEGRFYVGGDPSRILTMSFRRDHFDNDIKPRSYVENITTVKYAQYF